MVGDTLSKQESATDIIEPQIVKDGFIDMLSEMGVGGNIVMGILLILSILAIYILVNDISH